VPAPPRRSLQRRARCSRRDAHVRRAARGRRRVAVGRRGQRYAILGSNGAGKTTLFNAITGDFPPTAGRIHFFGEDITELPPLRAHPQGLRRTYQSSLLFRDLSVRDNLFLAVRGVAQRRFSFLRPRARHASRAPPPTCSSASRSATSPTSASPPVARPAAPARDRHGARRGAASDPVRRAGRRAFAAPNAASSSRCFARCLRT
jgi:energy-coupling factor transporter ATP-binding protein EcfA2